MTATGKDVVPTHADAITHAVRVKLADLADNTSPDRAGGRTDAMRAKYRRAWKRLTGGNASA